MLGKVLLFLLEFVSIGPATGHILQGYWSINHIYVLLWLLVWQPDIICRTIGTEIMYFSSMQGVIGPLF